MNKSVIAAGLVALGLLGAPQAHADSSDAAFLKTLQTDDIEDSNGNAALIAAGHEICNLRSAGMTQQDAIDFVERKTELGGYDSGFFVGAAEAVYCPAYAP
jgi:Protein of unknown function (DUF732)